ncbi:MAG: Ribbon-helix-helix protein, copG family [Candidatus Brocadiaceae bacterium]|nr:Ribbon-helix-helix protein, copG family [Candidatus Brocadiaceae bacterium]
MNKTKLAITLDQRTVKCIDRLVREEVFPSRSQVIQEAVEEKLQRMERSRLAKECAKLDPDFEKAMAEEGMSDGLVQIIEGLNETIGN